jgi:ABC-type transport system involved in multi-copper enzyme maturation permease subunit
MTRLRAWVAAFQLELRLGVCSRRFLVLVVAFLVPVALAVALGWLGYRQQVPAPEYRYLRLVLFLHCRLLAPLAILVHASRVVRSDVESGTWPYHLLTPLATWQTMLAKWLAGVVLVWLLVLPSLGLTLAAFELALPDQAAPSRPEPPPPPPWAPPGWEWPAIPPPAELTLRLVPALALGLLAYGAIFTLIGVAVRRPLMVGVIYGLVSEVALQALSGTTVARNLTVIYNVKSIAMPTLLPLLDPVPIGLSVPSPAGLSLPALGSLCLVGLTLVALGLAAAVLSRRQLAAEREA